MLTLYEGDFGDSIATRLCAQSNADSLPLIASLPDLGTLAADTDLIVVALWRPFHRQCDEVDQVCFQTRTPWLSVFLEGSVLNIGPVIVPGKGPCYGCYRKRILTHHTALDRESALTQHYSHNSTAGPKGFLPPVVGIAASVIASTYSDLPRFAGRLLRIDLITANILDVRVVGVHGCARCGEPKPVEGNRFINHMLKELNK